MNKNKEKFYNDISKYIEEGIIRELYSNDELCIFNFSDLYYIVCPYIFNDQNQPFGLITNIDLAKEMAEDNIKLFYTLRSYSNQELKQGTLNLSNNNYNYIKELIKINESIMPTKFINYDIEQEIMNMNKGKSM